MYVPAAKRRKMSQVELDLLKKRERALAEQQWKLQKYHFHEAFIICDGKWEQHDWTRWTRLLVGKTLTYHPTKHSWEYDGKRYKNWNGVDVYKFISTYEIAANVEKFRRLSYQLAELQCREMGISKIEIEASVEEYRRLSNHFADLQIREMEEKLAKHGIFKASSIPYSRMK